MAPKSLRGGELNELVLAYTATIRKSQGSEFPAVVIPLSAQHYPMLPAFTIGTPGYRRWRYTL